MITVLALDIDGVLTDGKVTLDESGCEYKTLWYGDIDAVSLARRQGLQVVLVTGENSAWVEVVAKRLQVDRVYRGAKDKRQALHEASRELAVRLDEICYIGDSRRDADAFGEVGLALAPASATEVARAAAHRVLLHQGGAGAVAEAVEILLEARGDTPPKRA